MNPKNEIRIFVDAHVFDGKFQGTRTFIKGIYSILSKHDNIKIYLAAYDLNNLKSSFSEQENLFFIKYKSKSSFIRLAFEIPRLIKKLQIDFAHFQYIVPIIKSCKFIVTTHDILFFDFPDEFPFSYRVLKKFLFRSSILKADIVTTVSDYSRTSICKHLNLKNKHIYITPNGVDELYFEKYDKNTSKKYIKEKYGIGRFILYVSRIEPRKNHLALLKAYLGEKLYLENIYLVLLGYESIKVPELDELINNISDHLKQFIKVKNDVIDEELLEFYRAAEIFVYPSIAEGFGIPPLEAAACMTPVLCSNSTAMSNFSFFEKNLFNPFDTLELQAKLKMAIQTPESSIYLEQLSELIHRNYSWNEPAEKMYQILMQN